MDILLSILLVWLPRIFMARCVYFAVKQQRWRWAGLWAVGVLYPLPIIISYWLHRWWRKYKGTRRPHDKAAYRGA